MSDACITAALLACSLAHEVRALCFMVPSSLNPEPSEHAGSYGKVFKALRGEVQDVAVKQLLHAGDGQLESFMEVTRGSLQLHTVHNLECWLQDISGLLTCAPPQYSIFTPQNPVKALFEVFSR